MNQSEKRGELVEFDPNRLRKPRKGGRKFRKVGLINIEAFPRENYESLIRGSGRVEAIIIPINEGVDDLVENGSNEEDWNIRMAMQAWRDGRSYDSDIAREAKREMRRMQNVSTEIDLEANY